MREFRRPGQRGGLMGTVIAFGIAALIALGTGAASSDGADATRVVLLRGHGVKGLPPFRVPAPSTMFWTNSGSFFQISSNGGYGNDGAVTSAAHRGTTYIPPGRYAQLRVRAIGDWTITIRTGVERRTIKGIVSSPDHNGKTRLPAGRYRLYIDAAPPEEPMGSWTITIR